jgi:cell division protein DivIC
MEKNSQGRKKKNMTPTHGAMLVIVFVALVMLVVVLISGYGLQQKISANELRMDELNELISSEEERTQEIEGLEEYMQSDEYLEQEAKDKFGFVKDGEIIFKESK